MWPKLNKWLSRFFHSPEPAPSDNSDMVEATFGCPRQPTVAPSTLSDEEEEAPNDIGHRHISQEELEVQIKRKSKQIRPIARYMASTEDIVEERIRKAMERGEFDNLKGKGRPLDLREKPFEDPDMRLAYKILSNAGYSPYWVSMGKDIDAEIVGCRQVVDQFVAFVARRPIENRINSPLVAARREEVLETCSKKLARANKKIDQFNLIVPVYWLQRKKLDEEEEMNRIRQTIDKAIRGY